VTLLLGKATWRLVVGLWLLWWIFTRECAVVLQQLRGLNVAGIVVHKLQLQTTAAVGSCQTVILGRCSRSRPKDVLEHVHTAEQDRLVRVHG
jgi:hypothetical protein